MSQHDIGILSFGGSVANQNDIDVYWIGHVDLDRQRGHFGLTNKLPFEDANRLAACYFDPQLRAENGSKRFLKYYYGEETIIALVREKFHDKGAPAACKSSYRSCETAWLTS